MKTYSAKLSDVKKDWWIIDAEDIVLGRLAAVTSSMLCGKHKPIYTPNIDCGDNIVIINAGKIKLTGKKRTDKTYYRHTGHPGGIKETTPEKILNGKFPERVVKMAIKRMIDKGPLGREQLTKLRVYSGTEHPHAGQEPKVLDLAAMNNKNKR